MPTEYEKEDVVKTTELNMLNALDKFIFDVIGNKKVYKLREILEEFEPITMIIGTNTRGYNIIVKLQTFDFPPVFDKEGKEIVPSERRVGIEFIKELKDK